MQTYEFIRDEGRAIIDVIVDGKPIKKMYVRGIRKAQMTPYFKIVTSSNEYVNPFSGMSIVLTPLEGTIYEWCMSWYRRYENEMETHAPIQTFDDMKYFLLDLNSEAYYRLLD